MRSKFLVVGMVLAAVAVLCLGRLEPRSERAPAAPFGFVSTAHAQEPTPDVAVTLTAFQATVASASTAELISGETGAPTYCKQIAITPLPGNTSTSIEVRTALATAGFTLSTGSTIVLPVQGALTGIWIDVGTNGDGYSAVCWTN